MRVTQADIAFAERQAFVRVFPSGLKKYIKKPVAYFQAIPHAQIHACVNAHVDRPLTSDRFAMCQWHNTLAIIKSQIRRGEDWKAYRSWLHGDKVPGVRGHEVIVNRLLRRMRGR